MTIRCCANCANFDRIPEPGEFSCRDQVMFTVIPGLKREPTGADVCIQHLTAREDAEEDQTIQDAMNRGGAALATRMADAVMEARLAMRRAAFGW